MHIARVGSQPGAGGTPGGQTARQPSHASQPVSPSLHIRSLRSCRVRGPVLPPSALLPSLLPSPPSPAFPFLVQTSWARQNPERDSRTSPDTNTYTPCGRAEGPDHASQSCTHSQPARSGSQAVRQPGRRTATAVNTPVQSSPLSVVFHCPLSSIHRRQRELYPPYILQLASCTT